MDVVLFRHAKKGMLPFEDPGLTPEGFAQGERLPDVVQKQGLPTARELWASEKIRTHQTLQALASVLHLSTLTKVELNLRNETETQKMFCARVQILIDELSLTARNSSTNECIYLCTHYDWIEEAMHLIPSDRSLMTSEFSTWAPAQYIHFKILTTAPKPLWKFMKKGVSI